MMWWECAGIAIRMKMAAYSIANIIRHWFVLWFFIDLRGAIIEFPCCSVLVNEVMFSLTSSTSVLQFDFLLVGIGVHNFSSWPIGPVLNCVFGRNCLRAVSSQESCSEHWFSDLFSAVVLASRMPWSVLVDRQMILTIVFLWFLWLMMMTLYKLVGRRSSVLELYVCIIVANGY